MSYEKLKKIKSHKKSLKSNRVVLAALAGAVTGLAITYLLESEQGRIILGQIGSSVKSFAGNVKLPELLKA